MPRDYAKQIATILQKYNDEKKRLLAIGSELMQKRNDAVGGFIETYEDFILPELTKLATQLSEANSPIEAGLISRGEGDEHWVDENHHRAVFYAYRRGDAPTPTDALIDPLHRTVFARLVFYPVVESDSISVRMESHADQPDKLIAVNFGSLRTTEDDLDRVANIALSFVDLLVDKLVAELQAKEEKA